MCKVIHSGRLADRYLCLPTRRGFCHSCVVEHATDSVGQPTLYNVSVDKRAVVGLWKASQGLHICRVAPHRFIRCRRGLVISALVSTSRLRALVQTESRWRLRNTLDEKAARENLAGPGLDWVRRRQSGRSFQHCSNCVIQPRMRAGMGFRPGQ